MTQGPSLEHDRVLSFGFAVSLKDGAALDLLATAEGAVWRHFDGNEPASRDWLVAEPHIDAVTVEAMLEQETRPRYALSDAGALLICRGVNLNPDADPEDMVSLRLWCDGDRLISVALRPFKAVDEIRMALASGRAGVKAGDLLLRILDQLTDRIRDTVRGLEDRVDDLEDKSLEGETVDCDEELKIMRRRTIWFKRFAEPQSDALEDMLEEPPKWLTKTQLGRLREIHDATLRIVEGLSAVREHVLLLQDYARNIAEQSTKRMTYLLTLVAGVFLPLNLIAGLAGANVGGIPGAESAWGFLILCVVIASIGAAGALFFTRIR